MFSFLGYENLFTLLCKGVATCYCTNKLDIKQNVSVGEFVIMHKCLIKTKCQSCLHLFFLPATAKVVSIVRLR